jgi:mono/diheme cytochrome c family protein
MRKEKPLMKRRDRTARAAAAGVAALLLAAGGGRAEEVDGVLASMGGEYFQQYCAACHGITAHGDGPVAGALATPPPDLTRIAARRDGVFPAGEIARKVDGRFEIDAHGTREMPVWGERFGAEIPDATVSEEVTRGKIAMLVEYLKSIQRSD